MSGTYPTGDPYRDDQGDPAMSPLDASIDLSGRSETPAEDHYAGFTEGTDDAAQPPTRRTLKPSFWRWIHDRNPMFLCSAVLMFAGYRLILGAMNTRPGDVAGLAPLIAVLNLYEAALIGLGLFLIRRRGLYRDGWFLLTIEALFLVDLTNLQSEVYAANVSTGVALNAICFALALVKIGVVVKVLRLRLSVPEWGLVAVTLAMLFGMAGAFKSLARPDGFIDTRILYAAWWALGGLVALTGLIPRADRLGRFAALPGRLYLLIPIASLIVHLCGANRVYNVHFHAANLAPVLVGLAVALTGVRWIPWHLAARAQVALVALAALLSLRVPADLTLEAAGVWFSPLRLAMLGAAIVCAWSFWRYRRWVYAYALVAAAGAVALGHTVAAAKQNLVTIADQLLAALKALIPTTPMAWGVVAVVASFVVLALGAVVSLRKEAAPPGDELA